MTEGPAKASRWRHLRNFLPVFMLLGVIIGVGFTFRSVLMPFVFALIIVYLMEPVVRRLHSIGVGRVRVPRWVAVILVYLAFFGSVSVVSVLVVPPLANEISKLASEAPQFFETLRTETLPELNAELQGLIQRVFPPKMSERHVEEASEAIHMATDQSESLASLMAALTREEWEFYELGAMDVSIEEITRQESDQVAFRVRTNESTGELEVLLEEVELLAHPDIEGGFIVRARQQESVNQESFHFDLEETLDEGLASLAERSGHGVTELVSVGQGLVMGAVSAFVTLILTFMIAAFISIDLPGIKNFFRAAFPEGSRTTYDDVLRKLDRGLSGVVRGQLLICVINGTLTGVGLMIFEVKFALILALIATVLSLIPIFGTIISTIPAVSLALMQGIDVALLVLGWILMIHFIEANILNPKIIGTSAHIHPVIVVFALLAGEHTFGLIGALLAVPITSILLTLFMFALSRTLPQSSPKEEPQHEGA